MAGAQSAGAKLVSFNLDAFTSYGKEQSFNAPVSEEAAFAYCTALNYLLASDRRRLRVGDAATVFWTEQPSPAEDLLPFLVDSTKSPEDEGLKQRLAVVLEKLADGKLATDDLGDSITPFYILGLSPNASRLSVRFWHTSTLGDLAANLQEHHLDLAIVRQWDEKNSKNPEPKVPGIYALLRQTARDADGIPPLLGGPLIRAILLGTNYPDALFQKVMSRLRVTEKDQKGNPLDRVTYLRAAIIKAYLNRNHQLRLPMSLDTTRTDPAYLLGRLFAVLEKTQQDALPDAAVGFLHRDRPGRPSLALDLMEEFRPVLADRCALTLLNRRQISPKDFRVQESGAVELTEEARKLVLTTWQERKRDEITHPFLEEKTTVGLLPFLQARLLARYLRNDLDTYPAFLWR